MKVTFCFVLILLSLDAHAQGVFFGSSGTVRTRVGSSDGPLAQTNIFGQFFAGPTTDSLVPVGSSQPHGNGAIYAGEVSVPGIPPRSTALIQLWAWDGTLWGANLASVPADQIGRTDIVPVVLSFSFDPQGLPQFTQGAIVPIPEPSSWALLALGSAGFWFARCRRR